MKESLELKDGHCEIGLPFRNEPHNDKQVICRQSSLKNKLQIYHHYHPAYTSFMDDIIEQGYGEPVPAGELPRQTQQTWKDACCV